MASNPMRVCASSAATHFPHGCERDSGATASLYNEGRSGLSLGLAGATAAQIEIERLKADAARGDWTSGRVLTT